MKKILTTIFLFTISNNALAQSEEIVDFNPYQRDLPVAHCTDEEIGAIIMSSREVGIRRATENRIRVSDFKNNRVYEIIAGENTPEAVREQATNEDCVYMALPAFRELYGESMETVNILVSNIGGLLSGAGLPDVDPSSLLREAKQNICSSVDGLVDNVRQNAENDFEREAVRRMRDNVLSGIVSDRAFDNYMSDWMEDKFNGNEFLRWRGGYEGSIEIDEDDLRRNTERRIREALRGKL